MEERNRQDTHTDKKLGERKERCKEGMGSHTGQETGIGARKEAQVGKINEQ